MLWLYPRKLAQILCSFSLSYHHAAIDEVVNSLSSLDNQRCYHPITFRLLSDIPSPLRYPISAYGHPVLFHSIAVYLIAAYFIPLLLISSHRRYFIPLLLISSHRRFSCWSNDQQGVYFTLYQPYSASLTSYKVNLQCLGEAMITADLEEKSMCRPIRD